MVYISRPRKKTFRCTETRSFPACKIPAGIEKTAGSTNPIPSGSFPPSACPDDESCSDLPQLQNCSRSAIIPPAPYRSKTYSCKQQNSCHTGTAHAGKCQTGNSPFFSCKDFSCPYSTNVNFSCKDFSRRPCPEYSRAAAPDCSFRRDFSSQTDSCPPDENTPCKDRKREILFP